MNTVLAATLVALSFLPTFEDGVQAYDAQEFKTAAGHFEELVYNRVYEPEVFYNLGNAYYRMGYLAPAIVNYERALRLDPSLEPAQVNLRMAIAQTKRAASAPAPSGLEEGFYFWHANWSPGQSRTLTFVFWTLAWGGMMLRFARPTKYLRRIAVLSFLLAAVFAGSWYIKANPANLAVADGDEIPVHYGPKSTDTVHFQLFEGDRVVIDDVREDWVRVTMADGTRGWAESKYLLMVWPPRGSGIYERLQDDAQ